MNIKHIGNPGSMTVEVTGIDSTVRAQMAESFLRCRVFCGGGDDHLEYYGDEDEYARFRRFLELAEGEARVRA